MTRHKLLRNDDSVIRWTNFSVFWWQMSGMRMNDNKTKKMNKKNQ